MPRPTDGFLQYDGVPSIDPPAAVIVQQSSTSIVSSSAAVPAGAHFDWWIAAGLLYLTIAPLLAVRVGYGLLLTRRLRRNSRPIDDPRAIETLEISATGFRSIPELAESSELAVPITIGWIHPAVMLPASWREWSDAKLAAVFAHELSHIDRSDYAILLLASLSRCMYWFSPLNWWLE